MTDEEAIARLAALYREIGIDAAREAYRRAFPKEGPVSVTTPAG